MRPDTSTDPGTGPSRSSASREMLLLVAIAAGTAILLLLIVQLNRRNVQRPPEATHSVIPPLDTTQADSLAVQKAGLAVRGDALSTTHLQQPVPPAKVPARQFPPPRPQAVSAGDSVRPATGASLLGFNERKGNSEIFVDNGSVDDALIRIVRSGNPPVDVRDLYLRSGESFTASDVSPGSYVVKIAYGRRWSSATRRFTEQRSFSISDLFIVDDYSRTEIILHRAQLGNFTTHDVKEKDFTQ